MLSIQRSFILVLAWLTVLTVLAADASPVHAQERDMSPSVFGYGYRGLAIGALSGLSLGYLAVRRHGVGGDDWKDLVFASGLGALTCAGAGVALGMSQLDGDPWYADYILRDSLYGVTLGALVGVGAGGLAALRSDRAEHMLLGAAIGSLIGLAVGITAGSLAANNVAQLHRDRLARERDERERQRQDPKVQVTVSLLSNDRGRITGAGPALHGTF